MPEKWAVLLLAALSLFTRFWHLDTPNEVVFDEVHFGGFSNQYIHHTNFFDIHPPLAKILISYWAKFHGYDGHFDFSRIGNVYDGDFYQSLRFLPALFGSGIPVLAYLTLRELRASQAASMLMALFLICDHCLLLESRIIVTDAFLIFFSSAAVYGHVRTKNSLVFSKAWLSWLAITGAALGCCVSVKWTALGTVGMVGVDTLLLLLFSPESPMRPLRMIFFDASVRAGFLAVLPVCIYCATWVWHFSLLTFPGDGDPFVSSAYRKRLIGNHEPESVTPMGTFAAIIHLQQQLLFYNRGIVNPHGWMSGWWSWPFNLKGIAYWTNVHPNPTDPSRNTAIYLIGNPIVWWGTTIAILTFISYLLVIPHRTSKLRPREEDLLHKQGLCLMGHLLNWLPFILIGRVTFLYHYLLSLYFAVLLTGLLIDMLLETQPEGARVLVFVTLGCAVLWAFCHWAPFVYPIAISQQERNALRWLATWT